MDRDDLDLFERSLRAATESTTGTELDAALDDLGWPAALAAEPDAAITLLFGLQGETGSTSSAIDQVVLSTLGLAGGETASVVLPPIGGWQPPAQVQHDRLVIAGLATAALAHRDTTVVVATTDDGEVAATIPRSELTLRPVHGLDPRMGLIEVTAEAGRPSAPPQRLTTGWSEAIALGRLAIAYELVGASRTMLQMARTHALEREQFGVPIASFQAVRHRLADTLVAIEMAAAVTEAAWLDRTATTALLAKATAGREARIVTKHCQQVLAGIGFTTEHDLHLYVRRVLVLDALLGSAASLSTELGAELVATRRLPPLLPL
jgi:hypothetical protein